MMEMMATEMMPLRAWEWKIFFSVSLARNLYL